MSISRTRSWVRRCRRWRRTALWWPMRRWKYWNWLQDLVVEYLVEEWLYASRETVVINRRFDPGPRDFVLEHPQVPRCRPKMTKETVITRGVNAICHSLIFPIQLDVAPLRCFDACYKPALFSRNVSGWEEIPQI